MTCISSNEVQLISVYYNTNWKPPMASTFVRKLLIALSYFMTRVLLPKAFVTMQEQVAIHLNTITIYSFPLILIVCSLSCAEWFQTQVDMTIVNFCPSTLSHVNDFIFHAFTPFCQAPMMHWACSSHSELLCNCYEHNSTQTASLQYPHLSTFWEFLGFEFLSIAHGFSNIYTHKASTSPRNNIPFGGNQE